MQSWFNCRLRSQHSLTQGMGIWSKRGQLDSLPRDFPSGSDGKESAYNAGDPGLIPGPGRSPGERNGNPLQYCCLGNPRTEEPGQSMGSQRVGQDLVTNTLTSSILSKHTQHTPAFPSALPVDMNLGGYMLILHWLWHFDEKYFSICF